MCEPSGTEIALLINKPFLNWLPQIVLLFFLCGKQYNCSGSIPWECKKAFVPQTTILVSSLTSKTKHYDYQSRAITLCLNHSITELFRLEGTFKDDLVHPPAVGRAIFHYMMLFKVLSNLKHIFLDGYTHSKMLPKAQY